MDGVATFTFNYIRCISTIVRDKQVVASVHGIDSTLHADAVVGATSHPSALRTVANNLHLELIAGAVPDVAVATVVAAIDEAVGDGHVVVVAREGLHGSSGVVGLVTCGKQNNGTILLGYLIIGTANAAGTIVRTNIATQADAYNAWLT